MSTCPRCHRPFVAVEDRVVTRVFSSWQQRGFTSRTGIERSSVCEHCRIVVTEAPRITTIGLIAEGPR